VLAAILAVLLIFPRAGTVASSVGDPTVGVLPTANDTYANWKLAGLAQIGGYPTRTTQCGSTLTPNGTDDTTQIQNAVNACTAGQFVNLGSGTFKISQAGNVTINKGITVRGQGPGSTIVSSPDGAVLGFSGCGAGGTGACDFNSVFLLGPNNNSPFSGSSGTASGYPPQSYGNWNASTLLTADANQGATSVTVTSTAGFSVGQWVLIDEASGASYQTDPVGTGPIGTYPSTQVWAAPDFADVQGAGQATGKVVVRKHAAGFSWDDFPTSGGGAYPYENSTSCGFSFCDRNTAEMKLITNITGNVITFDSPLTLAYRQLGGTSFTGSISGTALTTTSGTPVIGQMIQSATGAAVLNGTYVKSGSGTSWVVTRSQTVTSRAMLSGVHGAELFSPATTPVQQAGLENMTITGGVGGSPAMNFCIYCWVKNVEMTNFKGSAVQMIYVARAQIDTVYSHQVAYPEPGTNEYCWDEQYASTENLWVNSISIQCGKSLITRSAGAGSVYAYNYFDMPLIGSDAAWQEDGGAPQHQSGSHSSLFEGNWDNNCSTDETHGNQVYETWFRNYCAGYRSVFSNWENGQPTTPAINDKTNAQSGNGPIRAGGPEPYGYQHAYVGGVMGTSGQAGFTAAVAITAYSAQYGDSFNGVWLLGPQENPPQFGTDANLFSNSANYVFRHGNYDYFNAAVVNQAGFSTTLPNSFFLSSQPSFFGASGTNCTYAWPWVTPSGGSQLPAPTGTGCSGRSGNPAKARYDAGTPFVQP